jgi:uncharacterized membrane protein YkgB
MVPFISHSPFIFWLYPAFGIRGGAGSTITFATTVTIIPFMPNGWDPSAGFPAMAGLLPFLMKDFVLLAVSIYLLKQDVVRLPEADIAVRTIEAPRNALRRHDR